LSKRRGELLEITVNNELVPKKSFGVTSRRKTARILNAAIPHAVTM
jgi:hypothetical protein